MVDFRIELIILPVSDVDRARAFYGDTLGWPVDHDQTVSEETSARRLASTIRVHTATERRRVIPRESRSGG